VPFFRSWLPKVNGGCDAVGKRSEGGEAGASGFLVSAEHMIDLGSKTDVNRLKSAIDAARDAMRPFRTNRKEMLREFVGTWYNTNGARYEVLVNLLNLTADVYTIGLAANRPRVQVQTPFRDLWPFAHRWQVGINNLIKEMRFAETMQAIVLDAMFTLGIAKTHLGDSDPIQLEDDEWYDPGRPYISRISIDDFVMDLSVKDIRRCKFMSDEYRVSWDSCKQHPGFDRKVLKLLSPTSKHDRGEEQANDIAAGAIVDDDEYEPMVDLIDVWLPELYSVATFARHRFEKPLLVEPWDGPEGGCYDLLIFGDVPDNVMPSSPLQNLMSLHLLYNGMLRKQARQAKRQKTNPAYRPDGAEDAARLQKANDGEWVKTRDPQAINVISQGGVAPENVAFSIAILDLFDRQAGNLQAMAGLGPQAGTVGQEQLIHAAVSRKEAKMQGRVHSFTAALLGKLGHLMWADEVLEVPGDFEVAPGTGVHVDASWTPEMREGDFWQYNFEIEHCSMNYEPPEVKLQKIERAMGQLLQMFPIIQAAGGTIDVQELTRIYAEGLGVPQLENVVTFALPSMQTGGGGEEGGHMPQSTTRNYVRHNVPTGGTQQSRRSALQQALLGGGQLNGKQYNALSRPG
jgi:hypothetical protein